MVDDLSVRLGCYGHRLVKTPNIDALASSGVRFEQAHCASPLCNPSRASLLSGLRPTTTGVLRNSQDWREHISADQTLPSRFRAAGYEAVRLGKFEHARFSMPELWDRAWDVSREARRAEALHPRLDGLGISFGESKYLARLRWGPLDVPDEALIDGDLAKHAAVEMQDRSGGPTFTVVGFRRPHLPFVAPRKYFDLYDPADIVLPDPPPDDLADVPLAAGVHDTVEDRLLDPDQKRAVIRAYYAAVSYVDACVGQVLNTLDTTGQRENTVVALCSDHGYLLGEHRQWRKGALFEEATRAPLIISGPGVRPGVVAEPTELIDLHATLLDLAGLKVPNQLESKSLKPVLQRRELGSGYARTVSATDEVVGRSIRSQHWRYTQWGSAEAAELYDHRTDPQEHHNLAGQAAFAEVEREHAALLG